MPAFLVDRWALDRNHLATDNGRPHTYQTLLIDPSRMPSVTPRRLSRLSRLAACLCLVLSPLARASDISCEPPPATCAGAAASTPACAPRPAERLICDHALLSMGYARIYADQQRLLKTGAVSEAEIATFRKKRDACTTLDCLDTVFSDWKRLAAERKAAARR